MAAPTVPTKSTIVARALGDAGYTSPSSSLTSIAEGRWWALVLNDIWLEVKDLKMLQTTKHGVVTVGVSRYSNPTDFSSDMTLTLLDGSVTGTAQTGTVSSITLAAADSSTIDVIGREILITGGTGVGQVAQITDLNPSTKVATLSPSISTAPDSSSTYLIVERYYPVEQKPIHQFDQQTYQTARERPRYFSPIGDSDYGEFVFSSSPEKAYGMRLRYQANLMTLDEAGTLMATLIQRWENVLYKGIYRFAIKKDKENASFWANADADYMRAKKALSNDRYPSLLNMIQDRVTDYF